MYALAGIKKFDDEISSIGHNYFFLSGTAIEATPQSNCSIEANLVQARMISGKRLLLDYASLPMQDWLGATWPPNIVHKEVWDLVGGYSIEFRRACILIRIFHEAVAAWCTIVLRAEQLQGLSFWFEVNQTHHQE